MKNKLMTHLVCGYPSILESEKILKVLGNYSEYIEIQFPFSDPIADGPIISIANEVAVKNGITTNNCFDFISDNIKNIESKVLIMTYYNIVFNYGIKKFIEKAKYLGIYGLIIPDIPFDEDDGIKLIELCKQYDINLIQIVSPDIEKSRLETISKISTGFVYAVSQNMTTGSKGKFENNFEEYIKKIKKIIKVPIGVGFGIKTREDVTKVCEVADFAIIGSEMIKNYKNDGLNGIKKYLDYIFKN